MITGLLSTSRHLTFSLTTWRPLAVVPVVFHFVSHGGVALHGGNCAAPLTAAPQQSEESMTQMSLQTVSRLLGVRAHRIEYVLSNQIVAEPQLRIAGKRVFTTADVRRLAAHFKVTLPVAEAVAEPAGA